MIQYPDWDAGEDRLPLTGTIADRAAELVARLDGRWLDDQHATAQCPMCGVTAVSITFNDDGVALFCNGRTAFDDRCSTEEILGAIGCRLQDLTLDPGAKLRRPKPRDLAKPLGNSIPLRAELVLITGSIDAAIVLQQMLYWSTRSTLPRFENRWWFAKNHSELAAETGVGEQVIRKTIIPALVRQGLIVKADRSFAGKRTLWYSIQEDAVERRIAAVMS